MEDTNTTKDINLKIKERNEQLAEDILRAVQPYIPAITETASKIGAWLNNAAIILTPIINSLASVNWEQVREVLEEFPNRASSAMKIASKQGWFFSLQDSLGGAVTLERALHAADSSDVIDDLMLRHHEESWDMYEQQLAQKYPERIGAIKAAINAHQHFSPQGYFLSIPVFLAQADGIFSEMAGIPSAIGKVKGKDLIAGTAWVEEQIGNDDDARKMLFPILELYELDILKSTAKRQSKEIETGETFNSLNRHQVMHGEVSDYGTRINSAKAFSFLIFISLHIPQIIQSLNKPKVLAIEQNQ